VQKLFFALLAISTLILSGCATLSESQCVASDWETVGYRDGLSGTPSSQLLKHQNACVKHGVVPDRETYLSGWQEGVEQYCQPDNGFAVGQRGGGYSSICPEHLKDVYYAAYQDGRLLYTAQSEINQMNRQISQKQARIKQINTELGKVESALVSDDTPTERRLELLNTTKELAEENGQLETEIQDLKVTVALKTERLSKLRNDLAYVAY
jgi:hypothetical protein